MASSWRKISYRVIQEVITEFLGEHQLTPPVLLNPEQLKTLKRRISKAYPFVDRKYHPYKVWLSEVKANLQALQGLPIHGSHHHIMFDDWSFDRFEDLFHNHINIKNNLLCSVKKTMKINESYSECIGVEVSEVDIVSIDEIEINTIKQLVYQHKFVVFRNQNLNEDQYLEFASKIGKPQIYPQDNYHHPNYPEIFVSSNVAKDGKKFGVKGTGKYWHTDCAFLNNPLPFTMLYPQILPNSIRETYYMDMQQIYKNLPANLKSLIDGKYMIHEGKWRYKVQEWDIDKAIIDIMSDFEKKFPPAKHPAIITHPVTGAKILYMSRGFTTGIVGLDRETTQQILSELFSFIEREENIYTHLWKDGDILLWENRTLNHKASIVPEGQASVSFRIGIDDGLPFYLTSKDMGQEYPILAS
ncbi:MAG: TauD/TfdA family dioxygenase [Crocosphaera sp.]|nr:TauD/TfdA family dioxygenase [Crocosphaera sp.]